MGFGNVNVFKSAFGIFLKCSLLIFLCFKINALQPDLKDCFTLKEKFVD